MLLSAVVDALERIAPTAYAESWDKVGLIVGDPRAEVSSALLCIDANVAVLEEAKAHGCELVVAYHPPIFKPIERVLAGSIAYEAIRRGLALYSPHTALDVAEGGTNDVLADALGMRERRPLRLSDTKDRQYKLVTFVPAEKVEHVSRALFEAGAGRIGNYSACSFRAPGVGTFFGEEGANPVVGQAGKLEEAGEIRVETVLPIARVAEVVAALRASHPYEEPAFDLVRLATPPEGPGIGRVGAIDRAPRSEIVARLKAALSLDTVMVAGPLEGDASRAAVCAGAGGDLLSDALRAKADVFVTGELRHHDALRAQAAGMTVVLLRHSASERCTLPHLEKRLVRELPGLRVERSGVDREPLRFV